MAWLSSMAAAVAIGWGTRETFVARRRAGTPGVLAGSRQRPGRALARHGEPGRGVPRLPDAPRGEPGDWASRWGTAWRPARATRGGRSRASRSRSAGRCSACTTTAATRRSSSGSRPRRGATGSTAAAAGVPGRRLPGRGEVWRAITWPAYKACEPHVVLIGLTGLAVAAIAAPALWLTLWRGSVLAMAVLAPLLAVARIARAARRGAVEDEFSRWFRPTDTNLT